MQRNQMNLVILYLFKNFIFLFVLLRKYFMSLTILGYFLKEIFVSKYVLILLQEYKYVFRLYKQIFLLYTNFHIL